MANGRGPKGVFARGERDFNIKRGGVGFVGNNSGVANASVALFNNATDGTVLGVVGLIARKSATPGHMLFRMQFGPTGALAAVAQPLRVGDPLPFGQFYTFTASNPVNNYTTTFLHMIEGQIEGHWFGQSPMCRISPGWSLVAGINNTSFLSMAVWFIQER